MWDEPVGNEEKSFRGQQGAHIQKKKGGIGGTLLRGEEKEGERRANQDGRVA